MTNLILELDRKKKQVTTTTTTTRERVWYIGEGGRIREEEREGCREGRGSRRMGRRGGRGSREGGKEQGGKNRVGEGLLCKEGSTYLLCHSNLLVEPQLRLSLPEPCPFYQSRYRKHWSGEQMQFNRPQYTIHNGVC